MSRRTAAIVAIVTSFVATAAVAIALWPDRDPGDPGSPSTATAAAASDNAGDEPSSSGTESADELLPRDSLGESPPPVDEGTSAAVGDAAPTDSSFSLQPVPSESPVEPRLKRPPAGGVLFDVDSGEILWQRQAGVSRPIASLTKLMTALLISEGHGPGEQVLVSDKAGHAPGSATGLLPEGRAVPLEPLLQALIMISANDAAVALAEHDSGSVDRFIRAMNERAAEMGLGCSHFSTPNGLRDRGNYSCPLDLAALARADLADKRIAGIARTPYAKPAFPIKGGRLHLANNHYFLQRGVSGVPGARVTGLKTGLTDGAGRCYVTTARLGSRHLGVVLLGSPDPLRQVPVLLHAGFQATGELPATPGPAKRAPGTGPTERAPAR